MRRNFFVGLFLLVGCGDSGPQLASVSGTVTLDGHLVEAGSIDFFPTEGTTGPSAGSSIQQGKYQVGQEKGVPVGKTKVVLRANKKSGRMIPNPMAPGTRMEELVERFPPQFNERSTLIYEIKAGSNTHNFDLRSTP